MPSSKDTYTTEVIEAAVSEYDGRRYLALLVEECYDDLSGYVVTLYNETDNRRVEFWTGLCDFVTYSHDEAVETYMSCLRPKTTQGA